MNRDLKTCSKGKLVPFELFESARINRDTFEDEGYEVYGYSEEYDDQIDWQGEHYEVSLGDQVKYCISHYYYIKGWRASLCIKGNNDVYFENPVNEIPAGVARAVATFINTDQKLEVFR